MTAGNAILFIHPHSDPLDPTGSGGQNRIYHLIIETSKTRNTIVLGPKDRCSQSDTIEYQSYQKKSRGFVSDIDYSLAKKILSIVRSNSVGIIHIPYPSGIVLSRLAVRLSGSNTKIVLDAHDVMSERVQEFKNQNLGTFSKYVRQFYVPALESIATQVTDHVITVSEKDAELMERLNGVPRDKTTVIPNGADTVSEVNLTNRGTVRCELDLKPDTCAIVFHGNYETGTHNREAAERIINRIAPRFQNRDDVQFFIIGNGAPDTVLSNVTSLGFVNDLYSTLNAMDIAIVPLTSGTATKLKMFDYMSVGVPIVSTHKGTEGIDLQDGEDVIISDIGTDQFMGEVQRLLDNQVLREQIGNNGRRLIERRYNWKAIGERLDDVYTELGADR